MHRLFFAVALLTILSGTTSASESVKERLKSQLETARYEAVGLSPPTPVVPLKEEVETANQPMTSSEKIDEKREVLAEIKSPQNNNPAQEKQQQSLTQKTTSPPVDNTTKTNSEKIVTTRTEKETIEHSKTPPIKKTVEKITVPTVVHIPQKVTEKTHTPKIPPRSKYLPPVANQTSDWQISTLKNKDSAQSFCLSEASFDNGLRLMLAQDANGFGTLGINYGIDMLEAKQNYYATIRLDDQFEEDFRAFSETAQTIIVQLGRKQTLFQDLINTQQLYVTLPGVVSGFNMDGIQKNIALLNDCLESIGGKSLVFNFSKEVPIISTPPVTVKLIDPPVIASTVIPNKKKEIKAKTKSDTEQKIATQSNDKEPKVVIIPSLTKPIVLTPPTQKAKNIAQKGHIKPSITTPIQKQEPIHNLIFDNPQALMTQPISSVSASKTIVNKTPTKPQTEIKTAQKKTKSTPTLENIPQKEIITKKPLDLREPVSVQYTAKPSTPKVKLDSQAENKAWINWINELAVLFDLELGMQSNTTWLWKKNELSGSVFYVPGEDIIDAANIALDQAQESCKGTFDSQLGIPETYYDMTTQPLESKCTTKTSTLISTWLLIQKHKDIMVWQATTQPHGTPNAFKSREDMIKKLKEKKK